MTTACQLKAPTHLSTCIQTWLHHHMCRKCRITARPYQLLPLVRLDRGSELTDPQSAQFHYALLISLFLIFCHIFTVGMARSLIHLDLNSLSKTYKRIIYLIFVQKLSRDSYKLKAEFSVGCCAGAVFINKISLTFGTSAVSYFQTEEKISLTWQCV